jgi:general secretion pathway protein I
VKRDPCNNRAGFTLLECLVALAVLLAFAAAVRPLLSQARQIMANAEIRLAAQNLLHSLLVNPLNRPSLANPSLEGDSAGLHWRVVAEPVALDFQPPTDNPQWITYRITATVLWGSRHFVTGETLRLGKPK